MEVRLSHAAQIALSSLGEEDRRRVTSWIHTLKNWENDPFVRSITRRLNVPGYADVSVLDTSSDDLKLFLIPHPDRIDVIGIASRETLQRVGQGA